MNPITLTLITLLVMCIWTIINQAIKIKDLKKISSEALDQVECREKLQDKILSQTDNVISQNSKMISILDKELLDIVALNKYATTKLTETVLDNKALNEEIFRLSTIINGGH